MDDDFKILQAVREGDEDALVELIRRYREPVYRLAYRYVGNGADAANLAEETFAKVFFNAAKFRPKGSVRSWVFTLASNLCRDFLRRERRSRAAVSLSSPMEDADRSITLADTMADAGAHAASALERSEQLRAIQSAIRALPEKLRFPFLFCVLEGHPQEDAAEILKTTRKTVETRIYRARQVLQSRLRGI